MPVQARTDNSVVPFIRFGLGVSELDAVIAQDEARVDPLVYGTLMAKVAASQQWVPFTDETAVDGSALPQGIYLGNDIAAADIAAGDVEDCAILVGSNVLIDVEQLVIENSKTLDTIIDTGTVEARTVKDQLAMRGIFCEDTVDISSYENA
jgi:hypothetical protein